MFRAAFVLGLLVAAVCGGADAASLLHKSHARPVVAPVDSESSCVNNATHCTCVVNNYRTLIEVAGSSPKMCTLNPEEFEGHKCSCPGNALCEREEFSCNKLKAIGEFGANGQVRCEEIVDAQCLKAVNPDICSTHVNVFVDGTLAGCVTNVPVATNVDDAYGYASARANNIENVEYDRVNLRLIETTANEDVHLCVIYGNWQIGELVNPDDPTLSRKEKSKITADFPLHYEIKDDPSDTYNGDGTTQLLTSHQHYAYKSDGFCIGPLLSDGGGFRAEFYDLDNMLGLNVQTYDSQTGSIENLARWSFADHRPAGELREDGRANGDESVVVDFKPTCQCGLV
uniref:Uncharacterized protein n=1 Tax=Erythrolobus australicus TaxID=1077150 RepID=A0A7S1XH58_9RHOD|mmetsp:Transcript_3589/g.9972  ORF Transcript_3589/g.9972 Transcript_3589/m.9972 type:complete len:342 (+) Transcript_3589:122-1147(+)|eukprot:CAMPEP_0185832776 /NCGR_PEP_ID=MMETSP1353-20130828/2285_1 /TAXON_ID=1077150 /ORGANISM="Erythrolobus australicus, Strain CCMP3124" /LENGTH=341 /DNA_ID=CAMNT_0028530999 /DNA_START=96 /DNA_END=1121 /DNA_ORIENTATION=-